MIKKGVFMKSTDKVWFSAKELEKMELPGLPKQATNITRKALKENWIKQDLLGVKGGGYEYHITSLPKEAQAHIGFRDGLSALEKRLRASLEEQSKSATQARAEHAFSMIPSFGSITVSAGFGGVNEGVTEPEGEEPYSDALLASLGVKAHKCAVFWADGVSMLPTIDNGDQLLVDLSRKEIKDDRIYLVQNGENVWVKRVRVEWDNYIELISDNDAYRPIQISAEDAQNLQIIGQVVHIGHSLV